MDLISGLFDGPPPRAEFPYIALATGASLDWSHKGGVGRELSLALTIYDDGETAARLHRVMALVEEALEPGLEDASGWQIITFDFRRTRILRRATGPWSGLMEYRARVLKH
ncbi:MAG: DUF3168 domain-containing protein [Sphingomonadales bacterium]|nr:DUF3168 domain-containing protein [Sphingomonadales bacterium]NCO49311.1 DUF3168 domain-containing protein [Sphingomonadales bacterium]NCO99483.1 DUF3168 domain-containing protein [Sphingomonadales bacterium]NCP27807.1 DUF3168 domain-containing protein [Sphingomonadales bacterium]NCP43045.1 DUF3168 domain-containing protein [Sphingomonadales bacterium]